MRWTWIVCVGVALGCGPAVETQIEASTQAGGTGGSSGSTSTDSETSPSGSSGPATDGVTTDAPLTGGEFFMALFATSIAPTTPFQFLGDVKAGNGEVVMLLTPLSLDIGAVDAPREPVPPPFEIAGSVEPDGSFVIEVPELLIPGQASPVTSSDIEGSVRIEGLLETDRICARVSGMITVPETTSLNGSTLAGVRLDGDLLPLPSELDCG